MELHCVWLYIFFMLSISDDGDSSTKLDYVFIIISIVVIVFIHQLFWSLRITRKLMLHVHLLLTFRPYMHVLLVLGNKKHLTVDSSEWATNPSIFLLYALINMYMMLYYMIKYCVFFFWIFWIFQFLWIGRIWDVCWHLIHGACNWFLLLLMPFDVHF